jgi:hypothetical protein
MMVAATMIGRAGKAAAGLHDGSLIGPRLAAKNPNRLVEQDFHLGVQGDIPAGGSTPTFEQGD